MTEKTLLRKINAGGKPDLLLKEGYTYHQISSFIQSAVNNELVKFDSEGNLVLTAKGHSSLHDRRELGAAAGWIEPRRDVQVEKLAPNEIYIPSKPEGRALIRELSRNQRKLR